MAVNEKEKEKDDITYEIVERLGIINSYPTGWTKELNLVAWNGGAPKYDVRDWDREHSHMSRGVTMHADEMKKMLSFLEGRAL